jgi:methylenetetrahydrofolate--tRNA-(uracil-5-)-methyltransferase
MTQVVHVVGGGLAGAEAAWQAAERGHSVTLHEMRPDTPTPAHETGLLAELVCSNSFKSTEITTGAGLLKAEARTLGSMLLRAAEEAVVPAGTALSVDRVRFAAGVTERLGSHRRISVVREEVTRLPDDPHVVLASGPLTSRRLAESVAAFVGAENLFFYDALAPIVDAESIDSDRVFSGSRYGKGDGGFLNCPFTRAEYAAFWEALTTAEVLDLKEIDRRYLFEGCLPIEELAGRGFETIAFGPMRPVGLAAPGEGPPPFAVLQLRPETRERTMYGLVGCQTRLKRSEQRRVFRMVPGLARARFLRYGAVHRNTYIESPRVLSDRLMARSRPGLFMAGQIVGGEGYSEAVATGLLAGVNAARFASGAEPLVPPPESALGSLVRYISRGGGRRFSPMNFTFGLLPPLTARASGRRRRALMAQRALESLDRWKESEWNEA